MDDRGQTMAALARWNMQLPNCHSSLARSRRPPDQWFLYHQQLRVPTTMDSVESSASRPLVVRRVKAALERLGCAGY